MGEVDKKTGVKETWKNTWYECPDCGFDSIDIGFRYCPECGNSIYFDDRTEE